MKKKIDIEKALRWALIDEMPKGRAVSSEIGTLIAKRFQHQQFNLGSGMLPTVRDNVDALGFVPGAPHEDAEKIADAIARLDTSARFDDADEVAGLFGDLKMIAEDAVGAIMQARFNPQALVISHAIAGNRPQWEFDHPKPFRMMTQYRNSANVIRDRARVVGVDDAGDVVDVLPKRTAQSRGVYDLEMSPRSPLQWGSPSLIRIGHARAEYLAWFSSLVVLADQLRDALIEFEVVPPSVVRLPWITGQTPQSRLLSDGMPKGLLTVPLALHPKRKAPGMPILSDIERKSRQKSRKPAEPCQPENAVISAL